MAKKGIVALMACVFALCLALVGCGGGGNGAVDNKAAFVGTWDLVEMSQDGQVTGAEDLETLKSLGLEVFANFNDDGTMALSLFGESREGTWEASSATEGTIDMAGEQVSMNIADSKLTFEQEGASLTFEKGEAKEISSSSSAAEEESATIDEEASESESAEVSESTASEATEEEATESESESTEAAESEASESEAAEDESTESEATEEGEVSESESSSSSAAE